MTREQVQRWLDGYLEAWRTNDPQAIGALFSDDAIYAYQPYEVDPTRGRDAIVEVWLGNRDEPGTWEAELEPLLVDGDRAVATGETRYRTGRVFSNLWVMRFDDSGRCAEFVEWYMEHPR